MVVKLHSRLLEPLLSQSLSFSPMRRLALGELAQI